MSQPPPKPPAKGRSSLIDAAKINPPKAPAAPARTPSAPVPGPSMARAASRPGSASSTPTPSQGDTPQVIPRMKFKPKVPARRIVKAYVTAFLK